MCILIPEAKFSMKGTKCPQQCLVPRSPWAPTISRALSEHWDREVTGGLAHRGDDTRLARGTRTVGAGGGWERTHHREGPLYRSRAAELQLPRRNIFTGFGEAEAANAGQVVRMKPHWGGPDGHAVELGPGRSRDGRGAAFVTLL